MRKVHCTEGRASSICHVGGRRGVEGRDVESQSRHGVETPRVPSVHSRYRHTTSRTHNDAQTMHTAARHCGED